jgi:predicted site-specific integrase-resolvase
MPPIFVDARDVSERLKVSSDTVLNWVRRGTIRRLRDCRNRLLGNLNRVLGTQQQQKPHSEAVRTEAVANA